MTQFQYELICKIIENGAPALASELIGSLSALVQDRNSLAATLETLQTSKKEEKIESEN